MVKRQDLLALLSYRCFYGWLQQSLQLLAQT